MSDAGSGDSSGDGAGGGGLIALVASAVPLKDTLGVSDQAAVALILCLSIGLVYVFLRRGGSRKRGSTVLLMGRTGAGKTTLFQMLQSGTALSTFTSMAVNEDTFMPVGSQSGTAVHVVDVPGHERVRFLARDFLPNVGAVVFVVDATERSKAEIGACAAYLYDVLSGPEVRSVNPDVLVVCNKGDIVTAAAPAYVRGKLEEEIGRLRETRSKSLAGVGGEEDNVYLGAEGKEFSFDDVDSRVYFCDGAFLKGDGVAVVGAFVAAALGGGSFDPESAAANEASSSAAPGDGGSE